MEIQSSLPMNRNMSIELSFRSEDISIITTENPVFTSENGEEIYMGDNPDIFGLYIGKDHPLMEKILDLIDNYDETQEIQKEEIINGNIIVFNSEV